MYTPSRFIQSIYEFKGGEREHTYSATCSRFQPSYLVSLSLLKCLREGQFFNSHCFTNMICVVVLFQLLPIIGIQAFKPDTDTVIAELVKKQHDQQMYIRHLEDEIQNLKKTASKQKTLVSRNTDMVTRIQEFVFGVEFGEEEGRQHSGIESGNDNGIPTVKTAEDNLNSTQPRKRDTFNQLIRTRQIRFAEPGIIWLIVRRVHSLNCNPVILSVFVFVLGTFDFLVFFCYCNLRIYF